MHITDLDYAAKQGGFQAWVEGTLNSEVVTSANFRYATDVSQYFDAFQSAMTPQECIIETEAERLSFEQAPFIYTGIYKKSTLQAFSVVQGGHEYIGLSHGAVLQAMHLYRTLLGSVAYLDNYGNSKAEVNDAKLLHQSLLPSDMTNFISPKCPKRATLAMVLTTTALSFICAHEDAHLMLGHHELFDDTLSDKNQRLFQSLELDSDRLAFVKSRDVFFSFASKDPLLNTLGKQEIETVWLSCIVLLLLQFDIFKQHSISHPSPHLRIASLGHYFIHDQLKYEFAAPYHPLQGFKNRLAGDEDMKYRSQTFNDTVKGSRALWSALRMPTQTIGKTSLIDAMNSLRLLHQVGEEERFKVMKTYKRRAAERKAYAGAMIARQPDPE